MVRIHPENQVTAGGTGLLSTLLLSQAADHRRSTGLRSKGHFHNQGDRRVRVEHSQFSLERSRHRCSSSV